MATVNPTITVQATATLTLTAESRISGNLINRGLVRVENPRILTQFSSIIQQGGRVEAPTSYSGTLIADLNAGDSLATAATKPTA